MCGRFSLKASEVKKIAERFAAKPGQGFSCELKPRYNIAPTQQVLVVKSDGTNRELVQMKWGLIPHWAKAPAIGNRLINARAETLYDKPAYRDPFNLRRCLVPCDTFYEWKALASGRQPVAFSLADDALFALAALWDAWINPETRERVESVVLITTAPNELVSTVHNRMPVILQPNDEELWLTGAPSAAANLLKPYPGEMKAKEVSQRLNSAAYDGPDLLLPPTSDLPLFGNTSPRP